MDCAIQQAAVFFSVASALNFLVRSCTLHELPGQRAARVLQLLLVLAEGVGWTIESVGVGWRLERRGGLDWVGVVVLGHAMLHELPGQREPRVLQLPLVLSARVHPGRQGLVGRGVVEVGDGWLWGVVVVVAVMVVAALLVVTGDRGRGAGDRGRQVERGEVTE